MKVTKVSLDLLIFTIEKFMSHPLAEQYIAMVNALAPDTEENGKILLGLERAPAATKRHHAVEGGLVDHLLEMWDIWSRTKIYVINALVGEGAHLHYLTNERVLRAIIHHDLEKAYKTYVLVRQEPWQTAYHTNPINLLMNGDQKSFWILNQHGIKLDEELTNALFTAHGGFSENPPKAHTPLSKLVYLIDEMSGNVIDRIKKGELVNA